MEWQHSEIEVLQMGGKPVARFSIIQTNDKEKRVQHVTIGAATDQQAKEAAEKLLNYYLSV